MATYPGAWGLTPTSENFLLQASLAMPEIEPSVVKRVNRLYLYDILMGLGAYEEQVTGNIAFSHKELGFTSPKVKGYTSGGGGAGLPATYQLSSTSPSQQLSITQQSPYAQTSPASYVGGVPVREGDIIGVKPSSGYTGAANIIIARVTNVNTSAGTFVAYPVNQADTLPSISSGSPQEIIIFAPGSTEAGGTKRSLTFDLVPYSNNLTYLQDTQSITQIAADQLLWYEVAPGQMYWETAQQTIRYEDFRKAVNYAMLMSQPVTNTALASLYQSDPILQGTGLIPDIIANGISQTYTALSGFGIPEFKQLSSQLESANVPTKDYGIVAGFNLGSSINENMAGFFKNGAITYGMFDGEAEKKLSLEFNTIVYNNYKFTVLDTSVFSDAQVFGADGYNFKDEGMVLPAGKRLENMGGGSTPMIRVRKMRGAPLIDVATRDNKLINGQFTTTTEYRAVCNYEVFGLNATAYISKV